MNNNSEKGDKLSSQQSKVLKTSIKITPQGLVHNQNHIVTEYDTNKKRAIDFKEAKEHRLRAERIAQMLVDNLNRVMMERDRQKNQTKSSRKPPKADRVHLKRTAEMLSDNLNKVVSEKHDIQLELGLS